MWIHVEILDDVRASAGGHSGVAGSKAVDAASLSGEGTAAGGHSEAA